MKTALLKRLKRLEEVRAVESQSQVEFQIGYVKKLPADYTGERHVVTVGRAADGKYRWEERHGGPPAYEGSPKSIFRILLVRAKNGRPDYSWPEDAQP